MSHPTRGVPSRPLPLPARGTGSVVVGDRRYPSRADYEAVLGGRLLDQDDDVLREVQRHWHGSGQNGCPFAQWIAKRESTSRWKTLVVRDLDDLHRIDGVVGDEAAHADGAQMVSVLLPEVETLTELEHLIIDFATHRDFFLAVHLTIPKFRTYQLRYRLRTDIDAWVMAFGPFATQPRTRVAPITELTWRIRPKPAGLFEKLNQDQYVAHLADYEIEGRSTRWWNRMFGHTSAETRRILEGEPDQLSAAKMTLAVPIHDVDESVQLRDESPTPIAHNWPGSAATRYWQAI